MFFQNTQNIKNAWAKPKVQSNIEWSFDVFILASDHGAINYKKPLAAYLDFKNQILGIRYDEKHFHDSHKPHLGDLYNLAALRQLDNLKGIHPAINLPSVSKNTRNKATFFKRFVRHMGKTSAAKGKALVELNFTDGKVLIAAVGLGVLPLLHKIVNANKMFVVDNSWVYKPVLEQGSVYVKLAEDAADAYAKIKHNRATVMAGHFCFLFFLIVFVVSVIATVRPGIFNEHPQITYAVIVFMMILMGICVGVSCYALSKQLVLFFAKRHKIIPIAQKKC